jgi:hypothetical protein
MPRIASKTRGCRASGRLQSGRPESDPVLERRKNPDKIAGRTYQRREALVVQVMDQRSKGLGNRSVWENRRAMRRPEYSANLSMGVLDELD